MLQTVALEPRSADPSDSLPRGARFRLTIVCIALAAALAADNLHAQSTTVVVPAGAEWFDTGIDVQAGALYLLSITATGSWSNVAGGQAVGATGYGTLRLPNALAPTEPFASLIARVNDTIFVVGSSFNGRSPATGRLFLAMNDVPGTFGDNAGELTVVVTRRINPGLTTFQDPRLGFELLSSDPAPFFERPTFRWTLVNRTRPEVSGELRVLLDGVLASADPAPPSISSLSPGSEASGTFSLYTGVPSHLQPGEHTVTIELRAYTPDHRLLAQAQSYLTSFVPSPPPIITIQEFKATPDYQNQGSESLLSWKLQPTSTCMPADLLIYKKDVGQPDALIHQVAAPGTQGSKSVVIGGGSSPIRYTLSVACRFCPSCPTLAPTTVPAEIPVSFPPKPPAPAPYLIVNGPFYTPSQVKARQPFSVGWTFENLGGAAVESFDVELFIDGVKEGASKTISKIDAGKSTPESWTVTKELASGIHTVELKRNGGSYGFGQFQVIP